MDPMDARSRLEKLRQEIALTYGVGGSLQAQVRKIRRVLPRYERQRAEELARVEQALDHPKMQKQIDARAFARAEAALQMHLEGVDAADLRKGRPLDVTTSVLWNLVLGAIALVVVWSLVSR
ncbi:MAG: hypothetical protein AAGF13_04865 [Pseudomonadota bacterium]